MLSTTANRPALKPPSTTDWPGPVVAAKPFIRLARTLRAHFDRIVAYIKNRQTNAAVEGINNRLTYSRSRAYGFHSPEALLGM
jgi:transposase